MNNSSEKPTPSSVVRASDVLPSSPNPPVAQAARPDGLDFRANRRRNILFFAVIAVFLIISGALLWLRFSPDDTQIDSSSNSSSTNSVSQNSNLATSARPVDNEGADDADGDGLSDAEEEKLGTKKDVMDTDGDGLTDAHEVKLYQTNPLNKDTDGDGFSDGDEVKNLYNPNGTGKLFDFENGAPSQGGSQ